MSPLLPATVTVLTCWLTVVSGLACEPSARYSHPLNCSAFYFCDNHSNPNLFWCPEGLHYSPEKSSCDWPETAGCLSETKDVNKQTGVADEASKDIGSSEESSQGGSILGTIQDIIEILSDGSDNSSIPNNHKDASSQTSDKSGEAGSSASSEESSSAKKPNAKSRKHSAISKEEGETKDIEENKDAQEDLAFSDFPREHIHSVSKRFKEPEIEQESKMIQEKVESSEEQNNKNKDGELKENHRGTEKNNTVSEKVGKDQKNNKTTKVNVTSDITESTKQTSSSSDSRAPEETVVDDISSGYFPVGLNLTAVNLDDVLGYEEFKQTDPAEALRVNKTEEQEPLKAVKEITSETIGSAKLEE